MKLGSGLELAFCKVTFCGKKWLQHTCSTHLQCIAWSYPEIQINARSVDVTIFNDKVRILDLKCR